MRDNGIADGRTDGSSERSTFYGAYGCAYRPAYCDSDYSALTSTLISTDSRTYRAPMR